VTGVRETPIGASARSRTPAGRRGAQSGDAKAASRPSADDVARRAYDIFLARGATHGSDLDDWLQAEHELMKRGRGGKKP